MSSVNDHELLFQITFFDARIITQVDINHTSFASKCEVSVTNPLIPRIPP